MRRAYRAEEIDGPERARAITELILKYGTPAERLGAGPAFRAAAGGPSRLDGAADWRYSKVPTETTSRTRAMSKAKAPPRRPPPST